MCVEDDEHNYLTVIVLIKAKKQAVNEKFRLRPIIRPLEEPLWVVAPLRALWTYLLTKKFPTMRVFKGATSRLRVQR